MAEDVVSRLEKRIDELLAYQGRLTAENEKLRKVQKNLLNERRRCRRELDSILSKLDHL